MARKTHRASRTVSHQEVQRNRVAILNMGVVAALTFHIPVNQCHLLQRILGLPLRDQTRHQVRLILELIEAEGVRVLQRSSKNIARTHRALHLDFAVRQRLTWSNRSIMATQAQAAGRADGRLFHRLGWVGATAVKAVRLRRIRLRPKRSLTVSGVRRMAILARRQCAPRQWPRSAGSHIVGSQHIPGKLRVQDPCSQQ